VKFWGSRSECLGGNPTRRDSQFSGEIHDVNSIPTWSPQLRHVIERASSHSVRALFCFCMQYYGLPRRNLGCMRVIGPTGYVPSGLQTLPLGKWNRMGTRGTVILALNPRWSGLQQQGALLTYMYSICHHSATYYKHIVLFARGSRSIFPPRWLNPRILRRLPHLENPLRLF
jgi:hypothetical protein